MTTLAGLALGAGLGGSLLLLVAAAIGWRPTKGSLSSRTESFRESQNLFYGRAARRRAPWAIIGGLIVLIVSRWPVAAGATTLAIYLWPAMFGSGKIGAAQVDRLEALAVWAESLRDSIAGSIGLEQAIRHSITTAPPVLKPSLQRIEGRMRAQIPLPQALAAFAEEFDDSSADLVCAALILNSTLRERGLVDTLTALAIVAREEIDMRRKVEERRNGLRRNAMTIIGAFVVFAGFVTVSSRAYLAPYGTPTGQIVLAIAIGIFLVGLMWIRQAATIKPPPRFLVGVDRIDEALTAGRAGSR